MVVTLFPNLLAASGSGSLIFAFEQSTLPGRLILLSLFIASIFKLSAQSFSPFLYFQF